MNISKRLLASFLVCALLAPLPPIFANPVGESLVAGQAIFDRSRPGQLIINQGSHRAIINWADFSIGRGEITSFVMPSSTASVLNRVVGVNPSQLFGTLQGNGHVYIINPNGILVGRGGVANTRSLTASTLDVSDAAYLAGGRLRFAGASTASVRNDGQIRALGGDVFLIGHQVENTGQLEARQGKVGLAAGSEVILQPAGPDRLSVVAGNPHAPQGSRGVNNLGTIDAISAELKAAGGNIYSLAINNGGVIRATGLRRENGRVVLVAEGGNIENSGTLSAQNANGSGGSVTVSAGHNAEAPATLIHSGTVNTRGDQAGTRGGTVRLLGDQVGLGDHALVDVSGCAGGGTALVGGDAHGANRNVQNAERTFVGADAQIRADAIDRGDGGRVVVWADDVTRFLGSISARGGTRGGDGGFAEVSGKQSLLYAGTADLRAPHGLIGDLLLDPKNITVSDTGDPFVAGDYDFSDNPGSAVTIRNSGANSLVAALDLADVTLQANNDILITSAIDASGNANDHGLTLQAGRQIRIDAGVTLRGSFTAVANHSGADMAQRDAGPASFTMGDGVTIDTSIHGPHSISISYDNGVAGSPPELSGIDNMVIGGLRSGGGAITLNSTDANEFDRVLDLQGSVASGGGNVNLVAGRWNLDGHLHSGNGLITFTAPNGRNLILGADGGTGTLSIDDGALSRITASGGLKLVTTLDALLAPGNVTVSSATAPALTIESRGAVTFTGHSTFDSLVADAGTAIHLDGSLTTSGSQTYHDDLLLDSDATLAGSRVTFNGAIDSAAGTRHSLQVNASDVTAFQGAIGANDRLSALTTDAPGRTTFGGAVRLDGGSTTFNDAVLLMSDTTLDQAGAGDVHFNGSVDSAVGHNFALTVNTVGGGATIFSGTVGHDALGALSDDAGLGGLTTDAPGVTRLNGGNVRTTGNQGYHDAITLGADAVLAGIDISFFGSVDSVMGTSHTLTVNGVGVTRFNGVIGGNDPLSALTTDSPGRTELGGANVNVNGAAGITFNDRVLLTANTVLNQAGAGSVTFNNSVDGAAGGHFTLAVNTPAGANTVFNGAVGADALGALSEDAGLGGLTTDAAGMTALNGTSVRTSANQSYFDAVTLGVDMMLTGNDVLFNQGLNSAAGLLRGLRVNAGGVTAFNGAIGAVDRLSTLSTDAAGSTEIGGGALNINGAVPSGFNDAVLLNADLTVDQAGLGTIVFNSVDSREGMNASLTVNTPGRADTVFIGDIGGDTLQARSDNRGLGSLTIDGVGRTMIGGAVVRTTGNQNYADAVTLSADLSLEAAAVTLHQVIGGGNDLAVIADDVALTAGQAISVARLTLQPRATGRDVDLGTETPGRLSITQAEVNSVTATTLQIGSLNAGAIFVTAPITLTAMQVPTLRLASAGGINAAATPLAVRNLAFQTAGDVTLTAANQISTIAGSVVVNGRTVTICDVMDLAIGTVDGLMGIVTGNHSAVPSGNITLIADNLAINQRIDAGGGRVVLQSKTPGRAIALGTETAGSLSLTAAELAAIRAGTLKIGDDQAGAITISEGLDFDVHDSSAHVGTLSLESANAITETPGGWIQVKNLALITPSSAGAVLDNPMNNWLQLGASVPNGLLVVQDMDGYTDAGAPPNDVDGVSGVTRSAVDPTTAALDGIAETTYMDVPLFWPTFPRLDYAAPLPRPSGFEEKGLIWTSYLHVPQPPPDPAQRLRKLEGQIKWTPVSVPAYFPDLRSP